jgi:hypothetical protein
VLVVVVFVGVVGVVLFVGVGCVVVLGVGVLVSLKCLHRFCTKGPPRADVREIAEDFVQITKLSYSEFVVAG